MHRQHRQERNKRTGHQHREHIAEIGTGGHLDVLEHIGEGAAAFEHALLQDHQALFQQDDVSRFLGDVHGAVHRNTDIRRAQRRRVVDTVAHKPHHVPVGLEQAHDALLVARCQLGEYVGGFHGLGQLGIAHVFNSVTHQQALLFQAHFAADFGRHQLVVTGQHFDRHTMGFQGLECRRGALLGWVEKRDIADQCQVFFIRQAVGVAPRRHRLCCHCHNAQAFFVEGRRHLANARQQLIGQRFVGLAMAHGVAHRQNLFHRTLADQQVRLVLLGHHHRHATPVEVKRNLIDLLERRANLQVAVHLNVLEHRHIQQVFQAGLVVAVEVGHFQHVIRLFAPHVHMARQENLVLRQGAGLVGAQHVHSAEVLDRVQALDNDLLARQKHRALGQRGGDDHRQHFRGQAHGNRQREQQRLGPVALGKAVDEQHQRCHHEHETDQQPADFVDAMLERGGRTVSGGHALRQRAEIGAVAGGQHNRCRRTGHHVGAHEQDIFQVQRVTRLAVVLVDELLHRHRFAGHRRLADKQVLGAEHAAVGGNHVTGRQHDQITRHQLFDRQLNTFGPVAAQHRRGIADHGFQGVGGLVRLGLLPETQQGRQHHHGENHRGRLDVVGQQGDQCEQGQQQVERVLVAVPQVHLPRQRLLMLDLVEAVLHAQGVGVLSAQPLGVAAQFAEQLHSTAIGRDHQGLRQGRRYFAADVGVGHGLEHRQAAKMPGNVPGAQETGEELFEQCEVHGVTPARGNLRAGTTDCTAPFSKAQSAWPAGHKRQARP